MDHTHQSKSVSLHNILNNNPNICVKFFLKKNFSNKSDTEQIFSWIYSEDFLKSLNKTFLINLNL